MKILSIQTTSLRPMSNVMSFKSQVNLQSPLHKKILSSGYKFYREVSLIHPNGQQIKGLAFVLDKLNSSHGELQVLITDERGYELGDVSGGLSGSSLWCSVKNQTVPNPQMSPKWMAPTFEPVSKSEGHYRHVATQAYRALESYLRENYPNVKELDINAENSDSFDFHITYGFGDKSMLGEYDCYSMSNLLSKKI